MNFKYAQDTLKNAIQQRNWVLLSCFGLVATNLVLVITLIDQEEHWVLMPQYQDEHRLEVTRSKYSEEYLIDWASGILNTIMCANPESIDWKISQILKISLSNYGPLKESLQEEAKRIKGDKISTVFYPSSFKVDQGSRTIEIRGEHSVYFGGDAKPIITEKTFQIRWAVRSHGVILLEGFKEITEKGANNGA